MFKIVKRKGVTKNVAGDRKGIEVTMSGSILEVRNGRYTLCSTSHEMYYIECIVHVLFINK